MDEQLLEILGRPNFACGAIANQLRAGGRDIPRKAEAEQAHVIYWCLGLYLEHGAEWKAHGEREFDGINAADLERNTKRPDG